MKLKKALLASVAALSAASFALPFASTLSTGTAVVQAQEESVVIRRHYTAAHGDRSFTVVTVLLKGDVIVDAIIEEFQFGATDAGFTGVPNSDSDFAAGYAEGQVLFSKLENAEAYSALMTEKAGSTVTLDANFGAIEDAVKGKTAEEVLALADEVDALGDGGKVSDVVSGATLADTSGYLHAIADAVTNGVEYPGVEASDSAVLKQGLAAPHGTKSVALIAVAVDGDKVVGAAIDELQFTEAGTMEGVPNAEGAFGEGFAEGQVLFSKITNVDAYSALMAEKAGSTVNYLDNMKAIAAFASGKTVDEIKAGSEEVLALGEDKPVSDVVSGATLQDTGNYLQAIADIAAK